MMSTRHLLPFSGNGIHYPKQRRLMLDFASSKNNKLDKNGCTGAVLALSEFTDILTEQQQASIAAAVLVAIAAGNQNATPTPLTGFFVHLQHPGARPVPATPRTLYSFDDYKSELSLWEYNKEEYTLQFEALQTIKDEFINSLDPVSLAQLTDKDYGTSNLTGASILAHLDNRFRNPTAADLQSNRATLTVPFRVDQDFLQFIQCSRDGHIYAQRAKHPIDSAEMVAFFKQAISPCGLFDKKMYLYFAMNDQVSLQSFSAFSESMAQEWINEILPGKTTSPVTVSTLTSVAASVVTVPLTIAEEVALAMNAVMKSLRRSTPKPTTAPVVTKKPLDLTKYCYSHGTHCNHTSLECHSRVNGHNELATEANKMGGNQGKFARWNFKLGRREPSA